MFKWLKRLFRCRKLDQFDARFNHTDENSIKNPCGDWNCEICNPRTVTTADGTSYKFGEWVEVGNHMNVTVVKKPKKERNMKITDFSVKVAKAEGGKKQVNIGQIKQILRITNKLLGGALYKAIREL